MIRTLIVDDEPRARSLLENLIKNYCSNVEIVGTANDVLSGIKMINVHEPDLIFLDVQMPNYNGFSLLDQFEDKPFKFVFTTAYEEYAQKALDLNALGYLLKPIDIDELVKIVNKFEVNLSNSIQERTIEIEKHIKLNREKGTLVVPCVSGLLNLKLDDILYIKAEGRKTDFYCKSEKILTSNISLKKCESILKRTPFIRIHKSTMVNLQHIKRYSKGRDSYIALYNDKMLDVGKNYKEYLNNITAFFPR